MLTKPISQLRIIAVSATIPNIGDVAAWLGADAPSNVLQFGDEYRPVAIETRVIAYGAAKSDFLFDRNLNYRLAGVVQQYNGGGRPTLVFCATRNGALQAAQQLIKDLPRAALFVDSAHATRLADAASTLSDRSLATCVRSGVAFHSAALSAADRRTVEALFQARDVLVLCSTRTLALGVNLPAHLVVIKSTSYYSDKAGGYVSYSDLDVLQMVGRAGRPQFDTSACAVIMCSSAQRAHWRGLCAGNNVIESQLLAPLAEHLNAEIVSGTIGTPADALAWLKSTFLYVRALRNPRHYGVAVAGGASLDVGLRQVCVDKLRALAAHGMATLDDERVQASAIGELMCKYYVRFDTMAALVGDVPRGADTEALLDALCNAKELLDSIQLRRSDKKELNAANKTHARYKQPGVFKSAAQKLKCLVQTTLAGYTFDAWNLRGEVAFLFKRAPRLLRCLHELLAVQHDFRALINAAELGAAFHCRVWPDSASVTRQLPNIGPKLSSLLADAKIDSLDALRNTSALRIEQVLHRRAPFGTQVLASLAQLPHYSIAVQQAHNEPARNTLTIKLENLARAGSSAESAAIRYPDIALIVGDRNTNRLLLHQRFHSFKRHFSATLAVRYPTCHIAIHVIDSRHVGMNAKHEQTIDYENKEQIAAPQRAAEQREKKEPKKRKKTQQQKKKQKKQVELEEYPFFLLKSKMKKQKIEKIEKIETIEKIEKIDSKKSENATQTIQVDKKIEKENINQYLNDLFEY